MPDSLPPTCAMKFRPEKLIAQGGFGAVWLATQTDLARPVALKVLLPDALSAASALAR